MDQNSAKWNQVTPIESLHRQSLEYLYSKFDAGDTPTEQDFKILIDSSHNTYAHENTFISDTITTVQTNSAAWFGGGGGGGGGIDYDLRTTVSTNSADWGTHTDISDITSLVSSNSASWASGEAPTLTEIYNVVATNSAAWSIVSEPDTELRTIVEANSAQWSVDTDTVDTELRTIVEANSADWSSINSSVDGELRTYVQTNSAQWSIDTDTTDTALRTFVETNSASWNVGIDTELRTVVESNSAQWSVDTDTTDMALRSVVESNSAQWSVDTDTTDMALRSVVESNSAQWSVDTDTTDMELRTIVETNSADWSHQTPADSRVDTLYTLVSSNSSSWNESTDVTLLQDSIDSISIDLSQTRDEVTTLSDLYNTASIDIQQLEFNVADNLTLIQNNSAQWSVDTTDTTLRTVVETNSADWLTDLTNIETDILDIYEIINVDPDNSLNELTNIVAYNSAQWSVDTTDTALRSVVESNSAQWSVDITDTALRSVVESNSAQWSVDTTDTALRSVVESNSAQWATQTDIQPLLSVVESNSAQWSTQTDIQPLLSLVSSNSAQWSVDTTDTALRSIVESNSAQWSTQTDIQPLLSLVSSNSAQWSTQTDIQPLLSVVESNSAQWSIDTTDTALRTTVESNSAQWATQTDITGLQSTVQTNSAHWGTNGQDTLESIYNTVSSNSGSWGSQADLSDLVSGLSSDIQQIEFDVADNLTLIQNNSAQWSIDTTDTALRTIVETNSADWLTDLTNIETDIQDIYEIIGTDETGELYNLVSLNSAGWGIDTTDTALRSIVEANSAQWAVQTDITNLQSTVQANSAGWSNHTDIQPLLSVVETNSAQWSVDTTDTTLRSVVESNSASWNIDTTDTELRSVVESNSASWSNSVDASLQTFVETNSAQWSVDTTDTALRSVVESNSAQWSIDTDTIDTELRSVVESNSANWSVDTTDTALRSIVESNSASWTEQTDTTNLSVSVQDITTYLESNSSTWSSGTGGDFNLGGLGSMEVINRHVEHFYTVLPDEIVSLDISTSQEIVLRLFIVDCSGITNFLYRNIHTSDEQAYYIWFDDTVDGAYTSSDQAGNLLTRDLRWYIENGRARWNGTSTATISGVSSETDPFLQTLSSDWQQTYTTVSTNSSSWSDTGSGGGSSAGAFVTNVTCDGIASVTEDTDEIRVNNERPVTHALVDTPNVTFHVQWEGPADEWTGTPVLSGQEIARANTTAIGGTYARRFEGTITLDLTQYVGSTRTVYYEYQGLTKSVELNIAGGGPEIQKIEFISSPQHGQDHYKSGDLIQFVVEFNTADVSTVKLDGGNDTATRTYDHFNVSMNGVSATITAECETSLTTITNVPVKIKAKNALGTETENWFQSIDTVPVLIGPVVTSVTYGAYPGTQTELKDNDTISATFEFDTENVNQLNLDGSGSDTYASSDETKTVTTTSFSATTSITIDTTLENNTGGFLRPVRVRARNVSQQFGTWHVSSEQLRVNNQKPTFSSGTITYPTGQLAIKDSENAQVRIVVSNQGASPTYSYTTPRNELSIANPGTYSETKFASRIAGIYNISNNNYQLTVTRVENDNTDSKSMTVLIAQDAPTINITTNNGTRMRSGGNDNTSQQNYTVRITSSQRLAQAPTLSAPVGTLGSFSYSFTSTTFDATIGVHDNDTKGTHTYTGLVATNLAGRTTNIISSGEDYVFGGFVTRTVPLQAFQSETQIDVLWTTYNKLVLNWSKDSAVNIRQPAGTTNQISDSWCVLDQTTSNTGNKPITIKILDTSKTNAVSEDSTITIQETV